MDATDFIDNQTDQAVDESKHSQLVDSIISLTGKTRKKERGSYVAKEPAPTNFDTSRIEKVRLSDLVGSLQQTGSHHKLKKQLALLTSRSAVVDTPLPKHQQLKVARSVAYEESTKEFSKWSSIIHNNRKAEQLKFPLEQSNVKVHNITRVVHTPRTPLEVEIDKLLRTSSFNSNKKYKRLTLEEKRAKAAMSLEEARERHAELRRHRILVSYRTAKETRAKKIKSKSYRRQQRRDRAKQEKADLEKMKTQDPEGFLEKMEEAEAARVKERLTLKHRRSSKYAKRTLAYSKFDEEAKRSIQEMLEKQKELKHQKTLGSESEESDNETQDNPDGPGADDTSVAGRFNPWMKRGGDDKTVHVAIETSGLSVVSAQNPWLRHATIGTQPESASVVMETEINRPVLTTTTSDGVSVSKDEVLAQSGKERILDVNENAAFQDDLQNVRILRSMRTGDNKQLISVSSNDGTSDNARNATEFIKSTEITSPTIVSAVSFDKLTNTETETARETADVEHIRLVSKYDFVLDHEGDRDELLIAEIVKINDVSLESSMANEIAEKISNQSDRELREDNEICSIDSVDDDEDSVLRKKLVKQSKKRNEDKRKNNKDSNEQADEIVTNHKAEKNKTKNSKKKKKSWELVEDMKADIDEMFDILEKHKKDKSRCIKNKTGKVHSDTQGEKTQKSDKLKKKTKTKKMQISNREEKETIVNDGTTEKVSLNSKKRNHLVHQPDKVIAAQANNEELLGRNEDKEEFVDIKKVMKITKSLQNFEMPATVANDSDSDGEMMDVAEAFADDDVIDEFVGEKSDHIEEKKVKDIDLHLPGWGTWGGSGIKPSQKNRDKFLIKAPKEAPRKDRNLGNVIINEKKDDAVARYQINKLPFPFKSREQLEKSISTPIGRTWNPETSFKELTRPKIITRLGTIIEPMNKEKTFKKHKAVKIGTKRASEETGLTLTTKKQQRRG